MWSRKEQSKEAKSKKKKEEEEEGKGHESEEKQLGATGATAISDRRRGCCAVAARFRPADPPFILISFGFRRRVQRGRQGDKAHSSIG